VQLGEEFELSKAMQTRCLGCLREHYVLNVVPVSCGGVTCSCGYVSEELTVKEYRRRLGAARREAGQAVA
jgi:hypothetical protein